MASSATTAPPARPLPDLSALDRHLGDLVVEEEIARTALAAVFRVRTGARGDRSVALKVALDAADPEELVRFRHEVRLLSEAPHPNVVEVYDCGALPGGHPFLTMELLAPRPVEEVFADAARGDWSRFYELAIEAASGLAHIHRQGVIHCDVKPSNLGLADPAARGGRPRLKILDFGLAQAVRRGLDSRIRGTLAYVAPEVVLQDGYDQRADLYSLGLTLFELATGTLPSAGGDAAALAFHLGDERPDPRALRADMPAALATVLATLTAREPQRRYATAGHLLAALAEAAGRPIDPAALAAGGGLLSARLVGREAAIGRLRTEFAAAAAGRGRVAVVEGGEGMGKSRVLRELRLFAAVEGARVGFGRGLAERGQPLAGLFAALAEVGVEVEPPPPSAGDEGERGERYRLYRRLVAALRRATAGGAAGGAGGPRPLVLLLDDLDLGAEGEAGDGGGGAELLAFLAAEVADLPVLLVASRQPASDPEAGDRPRLAEGEEEGEDEGPAVVAVTLPPLTAAQSRELTDACLGGGELPGSFHALLHERSGGVPARLLRLLRHLIEDGVLRFRGGGWKPSLPALERWREANAGGDLEAHRLARLDGEDRRLLEAAAVLGEEFRLGEAAELAGVEPLAAYGRLAVLTAGGLVERLEAVDGARYALPRRLAARLRAALDDERRRHLHRRRTAALEAAAAAGAEVPPGLLAHHAWEGDEPARALPYLERAAAAAAAVYGWRQAAKLWGRAAEAARASGDRDAEVEAAAARLAALAGCGRYARAIEVGEQLLEAPAEGRLGEAPFRSRLLLASGRAHRRLGDHAAALESFRSALARLGAGAPPEQADEAAELAVELARAEATALLDLGRADEAMECARRALRRAGELGLERQRARLLNGLGMLFYARGDWRRAGRLIRRALAAAERLGGESDGEPDELVVHLRHNLGNVWWKTGDHAAARRAYAANLELCERTRDPWGRLKALNNLGILEASRGRWRSARDHLLRALALTRRLGARDHEALARLNLGETEEMLGDWGRAERQLRRGLALLDATPDHPARGSFTAQLASLARKRGDAVAAAALAGEALAAAEAAGDRDLAAEGEQLLGLIAKDREEYAAAGDHLARAAELTAGAGTRQLLVRVRISQADLALRRGGAAAAAAAVAAARAALAEVADEVAAACRRLEALDTRYELGRSLYEWGLRTWNPPLAEERLRRALDLFEQLGAEAELRRTRGALERILEHGRRGDRDPVLYEVVKVVNSTLDLGEVLDRTLDLVLEHLRAERGMVVLFEPLTRDLEVAVSRNLGRAGKDEVGELSESVVRRVIDQRQPVVTVDAQVDQRFRGAQSIVASNILSILCVPMRIRERFAGAIYVDHTRSRGLFAAADVDFLCAFADQAAVAIEKARLYAEQEAARRRLKEENEALRREIQSSRHLGSLIGKSAAIEELKHTLERLAQSDSTVLVRGESGTGKGLVARIIHHISRRREGPFVQFNCAALPETLVESELFGHEKGAFTGAAGRKPGRFELADGGTIFLDEVGKISPAVQAKLLRVVEDKRFERVGGTETLGVDVRIVAATNLNLEEAIAAGEFREDLYYRLNIIPIELPPLRQRREDVPYLVQHFLKTIGRDLGQEPRDVDPRVLDLFARHPWPGNVRELEAAVHRALVLSPNERLGPEDFAWIALKSGDPGAAAAVAAASVPDLADGGYEEALSRYDRRLIESALERCAGRIRETARLLGIARNTLKAKMKRYGIET